MKILIARGLLTEDRVVWHPKNTFNTYYADELYFVEEQPFCHHESSQRGGTTT